MHLKRERERESARAHVLCHFDPKREQPHLNDLFVGQQLLERDRRLTAANLGGQRLPFPKGRQKKPEMTTPKTPIECETV